MARGVVELHNIIGRVNELHFSSSDDDSDDAGFDTLNPILNDALIHILLPKQTPDQSQENLEEIEQFLLQTTQNSLTKLLEKVLVSELESIKLMLEKWIILQPTSWNRSYFVKEFPEAVASLQERETIAIYVRNQNSALIITKNIDKSISLSTFRCSLPSQLVMSNVRGELSMELPETQETIQNIDLLSSQAFAKQLHEISTGEVDISIEKFSKGGSEFIATRDVPDTKLVTEWIIGLLVPQNISKPVKTFKIQKKFRDQVCLNECPGSSRLLPFRRSGMYMALKCAIQLKLEEIIQHKNIAKLVYKLVMINMITDFADQFTVNDLFTMDLATQLLAKLGRRVQKLEILYKDTVTDPSSSSSNKLLETLKIKSMEHVLSVVERLTGKMKIIWDSTTNSQKILPSDQLPLSTYQQNDRCFHHSIPNLNTFIDKLKKFLCTPFLSSDQAINANIELNVLSRYPTLQPILDGGKSLPSSSSYVWLYDTENYIKYGCKYWEDISISVICQLFNLYISHANLHYKNDPLGKSQIYLVSLKSLEILDRIITKAYPLLLEYKPEVKEKSFDFLLLPYQKDIQLLDDLLAYFKNRERKAKFPGILNSNSIAANSFCVKYALGNKEMIDLRTKILEDTEKAIDKKFKQIEKQIQLCNGLLIKISALGACTCTTEIRKKKKNKKMVQVKVKITCQKCNLQGNLKGQRKSISRYEKPLPTNETLQWAVIFELLIPSQFAIFRDYLAQIKYELWGEQIFNNKKIKMNKIWLKYTGITPYKLGKTVYPKIIQLGSPTLPSSCTSHTKTSALDVLVASKEKYIINNGMECIYYYITNQKPVKICIQSDCSFKLNSTFNHECYSMSNLQTTLESTSHTQNSILARQNECHQKLGIEEFIAFGSLRAGHRIQLRNLYQAIVSGTLSLEQEPVLALILQTICQLGPASESTNERECHLDFSSEESSQFAEEFLDMLDNLVKTNEANYSNSLILIVAVVITRRIGELNVSLEQKCYEFLKRWRKILFGWISKIETALDKPEIASSDEEVTSLRRNQLEIIICLMLSYSVADWEYISAVIKDQEDVVFWLQTLYHWNHFQDRPAPKSEFFTVLQNFAKTIPLRFKLEEQICLDNTLFMESLNIFIRERWNKAGEFSCKFIKVPFFTKRKPSLVIVEYEEMEKETWERITHRITFDFILGTFLVNGFSQLTLPREVKDHKLFQLYFENDASNLRVQRESHSVTRTVVPFHGKHYEFHLNNFKKTDGSPDILDETLIIKEIQEDGSKLILLNLQIFSAILANYFIENYSHWLDIERKCVYFRPIKSLPDFKHRYILQSVFCKTGKRGKLVWKLFDVVAREHVLSINSKGFIEISEQLERLDLRNYINITHNDENLITTAFLRRLNLRFTLILKKKERRLLESVEYPGYYVSSNQNSVATFIGLEQGLLLENGEKQLILMPHSNIEYFIRDGECHQTCSINLSIENLRQPPYFVYEVDDVLKRLKAHNSKSAWLYLASLHGVTSSPFFKDPFTEVTGTEMAMRILQSACVWSCCPYDEESLATLNFIRDLSPKRKWYGHFAPKNEKKRMEDKGTMEVTIWPQDLPTMVAFDGYAIIVDKLIEDSEKLKMLHITPPSSKLNSQEEEEEDLSERLRLRGYFRNISMYNPAAYLEYPKFFTCSNITLINSGAGETVNLPSIKKTDEESENIYNMQEIAFMSFTKSLNSPYSSKRSSLIGYLLSTEHLNGNLSPIRLNQLGGFQDLLNSNFRYNWLRLYTMATSFRIPEDIHLFHITLAALTYCGAPLDQVVNLLYISEACRLHKFPTVPTYLTCKCVETSYYSDAANNDYQISIVQEILARNAKPFTSLQLPVAPTLPPPTNPNIQQTVEQMQLQYKYRIDWMKYSKDLSEYHNQKSSYERQITASCSQLSVYLKTKFWPCEHIPLEVVSGLLENYNFNAKPVVTEVNENLSFWYRNYKLKMFAEDVQDKIDKFQGDLERPRTNKSSSYILLSQRQNRHQINFIKSKEPFFGSFENLMDVTFQAEGLTKFNKIFEHGSFLKLSSCKLRLKDFLIQRKQCKEAIEIIESNLKDMIMNTIPTQIVFQTGRSPRLAPVSILSILTRKESIKNGTPENNMAYSYAGALGVLWSNLKRLNRSIRNQNEMDLQSENPEHENWSPEEYPEWLLLELELDIMIRPIQVKVAMQMMHMSGRENGVTQLNMGEGKTSVIVPMLCATLAQRNSQLCRVTVLSSMFKMNFNSLTFSIGGLLNKRVYSVPCKRDMKIDEETVNRIQQVYQECLEMEGVILTLPEYRLSFRLLAYDKMYKKEWMLGQMMMNVENFLRQYARDVLDESDELFSVKYQLVYTIGEQLPIDGGDVRWTLCQKILGFVLKIGFQLVEKCGAGKVEFQHSLQKECPHEFSAFRLLGDKTCENEFVNLLANLILEELRITESEKEIVRKFLIDDQIGKKHHEKVLKSIFGSDNPDGLNKILILSGYLRRGVLGLALTKRWRVEYGVNPKPDFQRLMAVPFRAKDVAAEKTEFGHPDLAIILTHLSYYYSGLSDNQIMEVFNILKKKKAPASIYSMWIPNIPKKLVPHFLEHYYSLNMKDVNQKAKLFQMLRKHKMVIDFWLSNCVFPRESKQFPGKLVMTAWDLCYERQRLPVTGFSGTNDSQVLLPLMITQQDLEELRTTNERMTETLLQPENGMNHKGFLMGVTCKQILESMKQDNLTVLIDAGALMLECSNEQVADLWLKVNQSIEAVVYFNEGNELLVKSKEFRGQDIPFVLSPYQGRLEKCGVFLDDQHTRGTDLKFPVGAKACVTVATRMKRDKLIQACMRMRKLGQGHSVTFYLSHEAHDKIGSGEISTEGVLNWVCQNTKESNEDGLLYWALAGRNYAQRLAAEDHFHYPHHKNPYRMLSDKGHPVEKMTAILANQCVDGEVVKLMEMYGQFTQMERLTKLIPKWFAFTKLKLTEKGGGQPLEDGIISKLNEICDAITVRCLHYVPNKKHMFSNSGQEGMMEEEQEKELELEKEAEAEEERLVERPRKAEAAKHYLHARVKAFAISGGQLQINKECFLNVSRIFENTTFWDQVQPDCWPENVYVTKDFISTISTNWKTDSYLRPIQYLISYTPPSSSGKLQLLLISPFEANELLPHFQNYQSTKCKLHMFSARRSEKQDLLLNNRRLQLPPSSNIVIKNVISPNGPEIASLLLASGNLYFVNMDEQKAFFIFLGLFPQPWNKLTRAAFNRGWLTKSGFWLPECRTLLYQQGFQEDPTELVKKILSCRHSTVSELTHLMYILNEQRYIQFLP